MAVTHEASTSSTPWGWTMSRVRPSEFLLRAWNQAGQRF